MPEPAVLVIDFPGNKYLQKREKFNYPQPINLALNQRK